MVTKSRNVQINYRQSFDVSNRNPPVEPNVNYAQVNKLRTTTEPIEIKHTKSLQNFDCLPSNEPMKMTMEMVLPTTVDVRNPMEKTPNKEIKVGSFSSDSCKEFILNPAAFSHVIESATPVYTVQPDDGLSSTARRKAAPKMGVRRLNYSNASDSAPKRDEMNYSSSTLDRSSKLTPKRSLSKKTQPAMGSIQNGSIGGKRKSSSNQTRSLISLDVKNLTTSCVFNNPNAFQIEKDVAEIYYQPPPTSKWKRFKAKDAAIQTANGNAKNNNNCNCIALKHNRIVDLEPRIKLLIQLSIVGCFLLLPIGFIALFLSLKAKRTNMERNRLAASEPYLLGMTPHYHSHQLEMLSKKASFLATTAKFCLLTEVILVITAMLVFIFFSGTLFNLRDLMTFLYVITASNNYKHNQVVAANSSTSSLSTPLSSTTTTITTTTITTNTSEMLR